MGVSALDNLKRMSNLEAVWESFWKGNRRKSAAGVDGIRPSDFYSQKVRRLRDIHFELGDGYAFSALRGIAVPKKDASKLRLICVPTVADRIVQRALLETVGEESARLGILNDVSYGFIKDPGGKRRGVHGAHDSAIRLREKAPWAYKADISRFFDTISREPLIEELCRAFKLRSLTPLLRGVIGCEVVADGERVKAAISQNNIKKGVGLRQGMPLSPLLSNFVLRNFDRSVSEKYAMVRYADDLVIFTESEDDCRKAEALVRSQLEMLGLRLSCTKSYVCAPDEPVEFLGMELGLGNNGRYQLAVSSEQMKAIRYAFTRYHDVTILNKDGLDASKLHRKLEQMRVGYSVAYGAADNFKELDEKLHAWATNCIRRVYTSIFTPAAIASLSTAQKRFLLIQ